MKNLERQEKFAFLSSALAYFDNTTLLARLDTSRAKYGWGTTQVVEFEHHPVFVKRIPLTDKEFQHAFSTENIYELPNFYHYPLGSVGFGCFRELLLSIKTSNWVLAGKLDLFPLLFHYRIVSTTQKFAEIDRAYHERYVRYWAGNKNIGRYLLERASAKRQLILCLEYIPYTVSDWLKTDIAKMSMVMEQMQKAIRFLQSRGIIHFDMHFDNMLTDGNQIYLTDFGLAIDTQFTLDEEEILFFQQHQHYDDAKLFWRCGYQLFLLYRSLSQDDKREVNAILHVNEDTPSQVLLPRLLENIDKLEGQAWLADAQPYLGRVKTYRPIIDLVHTFLTEMRQNDKKDTQLDVERLNTLLAPHIRTC